jgi:predicted nucleotide-binding protein
MDLTMAKFSGTEAELKLLIERIGLRGKWDGGGGKPHQFRDDSGAIMNWWPSKGTINFQGPADAKKVLEDAVTAALNAGGAPAPVAALPVKAPDKPKTIFVVHGHDSNSREQLERILLILKLEHFVLQNTAGGGMTIIESLEQHIGKEPAAEFGIVLMTPDDVGYAKRDGDKEAKARARQNVVLETGMLISSLGRKKVAILVKGHVELPSDAQGIIYLHYNDHVKETLPKLAQRLREAGFDLDPDALSRASS